MSKRKTASDTAPQVRVKTARLYREIQHYIQADAQPLALPEIDEFERKQTYNEPTYPPLILDGASGVGKTQQAFCLLKGGRLRDGGGRQKPQSLVYVLLTKGAYERNTQEIYREMIHFTSMDGFLTLVDNAVKESNEISMGSLKASMNCAERQNRQHSMGLVHWISERVLNYNSQGQLDVPHWLEQRDFRKQLDSLKGTVLFVDEVLPSSSEKSQTRLKFLRNFGRVAKMRVVLAGTAATAANMPTMREPTADDHGGAISRTKRDHKTLGEVQFL